MVEARDSNANAHTDPAWPMRTITQNGQDQNQQSHPEFHRRISLAKFRDPLSEQCTPVSRPGSRKLAANQANWNKYGSRYRLASSRRIPSWIVSILQDTIRMWTVAGSVKPNGRISERGFPHKNGP